MSFINEYHTILLFPQCQVMYCFTEVLRNFLAVELPRQQELLQEERSQIARDLGRWEDEMMLWRVLWIVWSVGHTTEKET